MTNHRIAKLVVVAVAAASLSRAGWSENVEGAPRLGGIAAPSVAAPAAALPSIGGLSLEPSFISAPGSPAAAAQSADAIEAARLEAPAATLASSLPKGEVRRTVATFASAVSDPKHSATTIGRAFAGGGRGLEPGEDEAEQASEGMAALEQALAAVNREASAIRAGRFGIQLRAELHGTSLAIKAAFTFNGRPITPQTLSEGLRSGQIQISEWRRAQAVLAPVAQRLAQQFMAGLQGQTDASIGRAVAARAHSIDGASFRTITGPGSQGPEEPPHLTSAHFDGLINKLVAVDRSKSGARGPSLREEDVERLAHVLTTIDRLNVDPIPTAAWQRALNAMAHAAKHAFHPEKYDWSKTVTLLLKMAVRRLLDLHSGYFDAKENKAFEDHTEHLFAGIGLQYVATRAGLVSFVYPGGPAEKAGLKAGDKIVSIEGVPAAQVESFNEKLSGKTQVHVVVERERKVQTEITLPAGAGKAARVVEESEFGKITHVVANGPAAKAGVKVGDRVLSMNDTKLTQDDPMALMKKSRGEAGTPVKLRLERDGKALPEMTVIRAELDVPNVFSKMAAPGVGYVNLAIFSSDAGKAVFKEIGKLRKQGARKLVLDLRANPGGDVNAVSSILASFAKDDQTLISFKRQGELMFANIADGDGAFSDMPVVVLVNGFSASGSEATSGGLQDLRGKVVVGARTYGKGTMQTTEADEQGRGLHLTQARWYTPADRSIDAERDPKNEKRWINLKGTGGVVPDYEVPLSKEHEAYLIQQLQYQLHGQPLDRPEVEDPQLKKALEVLAGLK